MTFSWRYFERVATYYHALMLTFLAGMAGFCLTGDIFDMFVWFELMGVSAYALTAYRPRNAARSRARSTSPSPTASAPTCRCRASA